MRGQHHDHLARRSFSTGAQSHCARGFFLDVALVYFLGLGDVAQASQRIADELLHRVGDGTADQRLGSGLGHLECNILQRE
ncbi:hypothetical protein D9M71_724870 [compost metagenome]